jgi:uncharacterized protein GlcG (DUF336 family)
LLERERSGLGQMVEVSMMEASYFMLASNLGALFRDDGTSRDIGRTGNRHGGLSLCPYNVYPTRDGFIAIICINDRQFLALTKALELPELGENPAYVTNRQRVPDMEAIDVRIAQRTVAYDKADLFDLLMRHHVPAAPVRTLPEVIGDPHLHQRGALRWIEHPEFGHIVIADSALRLCPMHQARRSVPTMRLCCRPHCEGRPRQIPRRAHMRLGAGGWIMQAALLFRSGTCAAIAVLMAAGQPARADLPMHRDLPYAVSLAIAQAAVESCASKGYAESAVVVDRDGETIVAIRGDNAAPPTMENARRKAYTALSFRTSTTEYAKRFADNNPVVRQQVTLPSVIAIPGGLPIKAGDDIVGGVGASGSPGVDEACVQAGLDKVGDQLR